MKNITKNINSGTGFYLGEVTAKIIKNNNIYKMVKTHNQVTNEFLKYIVEGIFKTTKASQRPNAIRLYDNNGRSIGNISFSGSPEEEANTSVEGSPSITYNFFIPDIYISGKDVNKVELLSVGDEVYATVNNLGLSIPDNANLDISWTISISEK